MTRRCQIVISAVDYARLEPMIRDTIGSGSTPRELLVVLKPKTDQAQPAPIRRAAAGNLVVAPRPQPPC